MEVSGQLHARGVQFNVKERKIKNKYVLQTLDILNSTQVYWFSVIVKLINARNKYLGIKSTYLKLGSVIFCARDVVFLSS
jgi:hypothetical protein